MKFFFVTDQKEKRAIHKGTRVTVSDVSGFRWVTWKGVKYFLHYDFFVYSVQCRIEKGETKEEILDEMWDIFKEIPQNA